MFCKMTAYMIAHDVVQVRMTSDGKQLYSLSCWAKPSRNDSYISYGLYIKGARFDGMLKHVRKGTRLVVFGNPRVHVFLKRDGSYGSVIRIFVDSMEFAPSSYAKSDSCEESIGGSLEGGVPTEMPVEVGIEEPPVFDLNEVPF